ncbi:MAG: histidine ammonia-lyase [Phycisphaerales bacterium]|nr:histidine ammonia-lyase [Phycisphaerales bacterium]
MQRSSSVPPIELAGLPLSIDQVTHAARSHAAISLAHGARGCISRARAVVERATSDGLPHYGVNTGFGSLARRRIDANDLRELQRNLVRSHAAGIGPPLPNDVVRGMMLLTAASLTRGRSGVRVEVVESLVAMLNAGITPVVPSIGSVGASGDLAPLAHVALALIGEGEVVADGRVQPAGAAMRARGIEPVTLEAKEGLALINGTHLMAAQGALACHDFGVLFRAALVAGAMSIDACRATDAFLDERVHESRSQPGQTYVARELTRLMRGSEIVRSHIENDPRVQDPYSLRCMPPVLGGAWDAFHFVKSVIERELGAVTDNPLVFAEPDTIISAGNFHGMPLAIPLDLLAIAVSHVAGISERRTYLMLAATDPEAHLTAYLSPKPGLHSGLMISQYTAAAACNEIIGLATPASVSNIPTSAGTEDYNSFGPRSAAKARRAIELAEHVVAIELLCAAQGIELHRPLKAGVAVEHAIERIRREVPPLAFDRPPTADINSIVAMIRGSELG